MIRLLEYGAEMERKWPVAPVSRMAVVMVGGGEEPKLIGEDATVCLLVLNRASGGCTGSGEGVPLAQLGLLFSLLNSVGHTQMTRASRRPDWIMLQPPMRLFKVASLQRPGNRLLHVFEVWEWRPGWRLRPWLQQ